MVAETVNVVIDELCHRCGRRRESADVLTEKPNHAKGVPETLHPGYPAARSRPLRKGPRQSPLQIRSHRYLGKIEILNGGTVMVKAGDVVAVREKAKTQLRVTESIKLAEGQGMPAWVAVDASKLEGVFKKAPDRDEFGAEIKEALIVELYSR